MHLDSQTARDLELFQGPGGAPGLFDVLDRTRTRSGRDALRARWRKPLSDRSVILSVQESLRFIGTQRGAFSALPGEKGVFELLDRATPGA